MFMKRQVSKIDMLRVEERRQALGLSMAEFARRIGESPQAVFHWKTRGVPYAKEDKVAEVLGCSREWLRAEEAMGSLSDEMNSLRPILAWETEEELPRARYVLIPRFSVVLGAGPGKLHWEADTEHPLAFLSDWVRDQRMNPKHLVTFTVEGDSMVPTLRDGSVLLVDLSQTQVISGRIYALRYGDELRVKRLFRRHDGALIIRSDNAELFPEEVVSPADLEQVKVLGRVVWAGGLV